ncbi:MAG TPA: cyclic nucleotide-binding domain-containing protein, partial [Acidimicrobiales bacterium]|nr:cyclic nucleotide-binding domain-containing protein [Acidimicrobiales bacterium]
MRPLSVTAGTVLFRTGDRGDTCFLVERGTLRVLTALDGDLLATLGPGSFVGELAVLLDEPRSATVIAEADADLLELSRTDIDSLMADHPSLALGISRALGRRIVATNERFVGSRAARRTIVWPPLQVAAMAHAIATGGGRVAVAAVGGAALSGTRHLARVKAPDYGSDDASLDVVLIGIGEERSARAEAVVAGADHVLCFAAPPPWL